MRRNAVAGPRARRACAGGLLLAGVLLAPGPLAANTVGRFTSILRPLTVWVDVVIAASGPLALLGLVSAAGMYMASDDDRGFKKGLRVSVAAFAVSSIIAVAGLFGLSGAVVG